MSSSSDELRARLAAVKPGDKVTATFEFKGGELKVTGVVHDLEEFRGPLRLTSAGTLMWSVGESIATELLSLDSHIPAPPPEPEGDAIYSASGYLFEHAGPNWWVDSEDTFIYTWAQLVCEYPNGTVYVCEYPNGTVYVPREKGEDR